MLLVQLSLPAAADAPDVQSASATVPENTTSTESTSKTSTSTSTSATSTTPATSTSATTATTNETILELEQPKFDDSVSLPPVPEQLTPGHAYLNGSVSDTNSSDIWFEIPAALAGTWHSDFNSTDGKPETPFSQNCSWGTEVDAKGNIWNLRRLPNTHSAKGTGCTTKFLTDAVVYKRHSNALLSRSHKFVSEVSDSKNIILDTYQEEETAKFEVLDDGSVTPSTLCGGLI